MEHPTPTFSSESSGNGNGTGESTRKGPIDDSRGRNRQEQTEPREEGKKPSKLKQIWTKTGLDVPTLLMMLKGSLPPTIGIAIYQAPDVANQYQTIGYLIAIASILGMCIMPRGKFLQSMLLNIIGIGIGASVNLLALYCGIQARLHTTAPGAPPTGYNSSQSAVLAVWLFVQTYLTNALRARLPQFQFPVILYSIFTIVSLTYGTQFPSMTYAVSFMERLLEGFLTGFGLATAVALFFVPVSSRTVVFKEMSGYLNVLGGMLKGQGAYLASLEGFDPEVERRRMEEAKDEEKKKKKKKGGKKDGMGFMETKDSVKLKGMMEQLYGLHTKLPADIKCAKREFAIGKLSSTDIGEVFKRMKPIMIPVMGLNTVIDILRRRAEQGGWTDEHPDEQEAKTEQRSIENLHQLMHALHEPFATMSSSINRAFQHVLITLEIEKRPKKGKQDEENRDNTAPGSAGFAEAYKEQLDDFFENKKRNLRDWCAEHGIHIPDDFFESASVRPEDLDLANKHIRRRSQRQLFFGLYVEFLLWRAGQAALELVLYVDKRKSEGAFQKTRLILPGVKTLKKWGRAIFGREDLNNEDQYTVDLNNGGSSSLYLGESFSSRKDPEHLPPRNGLEKVGEVIRLIPRALRSDASAFGFRVSAATMTIGIICYLHDTQQFFLKERLLWAMIMVPISMTRTAGQSTFTFALRILGTLVAMIGSYIIWYIVDGKTPGVIVFLWLWIFCAYYVILKKQKLIIVGILGAVTSILIIGYELQVDVIGTAAATTNGQPAYPTYALAPYRLATVCGGLLVAYIWTIFPYPISETTELRKDIGAALYLLANLYSIVHETIRSRVQQIDGDENVKGTRAYHLSKVRSQVFLKLIGLISTLEQNSAFSKAQIRVGGQFPREEYEGLIGCLQRLVQYTSLLSYASGTFSTTHATPSSAEWSQDFRRLLASSNATSHRLTSLLSLLSSSMLHGRPLPPYLEIPQHGKFVDRLNEIDRDILSVRHVAEPEYSAFAATTICAVCINQDIVKITKHVKTLVGEIDFSFHAISTSDESGSDGCASSSIDSVGEEKKED
ncbi:hypothetical protein DOTSEDRAFT_68258 [Lecanosticta acicola]|uniref:ER transporter 6TM N-terminal domain-containing protein n=1 Tax=Lecanosticta acicola TaxID=111012 RepID=A0AAI8Z1C5_9PEZI|nr:hypothetical protein DOTSEDRAFT_68258 [Lecanosticta acicola]